MNYPVHVFVCNSMAHNRDTGCTELEVQDNVLLGDGKKNILTVSCSSIFLISSFSVEFKIHFVNIKL